MINRYIEGYQCKKKEPMNVTGLQNTTSCPTNSYITSGFIQLQASIDWSLIQVNPYL